MQINFVSSLDHKEICTMESKIDNIEIMMGSETDDIIDELFKSFLKGYQKNLEEKMKDSKFVFESIDLLYYHPHKISLKRGGSYVESAEWLKNKRATINPKNDHDNCFQYAVTVALNHENIENHPERISNIESFVNQYNWKDMTFNHTKKTGKHLNKIIRQLHYQIYTGQYWKNKICIQIKI